jgi:antitoxin Phd
MADSSVPPASASPLSPALTAISATEAKNNFGAVLDKVMAHGKVAITKYDEVRAVVLSLREYETLLAKQHDPLSALGEEFATLLERMQTPRAKAAGRGLFDASPERLGRAALAGARAPTRSGRRG